ncbi:unnamed protein product [Gongylonema pulchrum]|uniref:Uncharacterized protein n=1 Tax=Gongylonema pulchrum TaxID=637853 RepID=A0A183DG06_9BILA|nr:unnamed protein product [Gongylonema pulchrum]
MHTAASLVDVLCDGTTPVFSVRQQWSHPPMSAVSSVMTLSASVLSSSASLQNSAAPSLENSAPSLESDAPLFILIIF